MGELQRMPGKFHRLASGSLGVFCPAFPVEPHQDDRHPRKRRAVNVVDRNRLAQQFEGVEGALPIDRIVGRERPQVEI